MFTTKIIKELEVIRNRNLKTDLLVDSEIHSILNVSESEILSQAGFKYVNNLTNKTNELKTNINARQKGQYLLDEIKEVAIGFNLRFLELKHYKVAPPESIAEDIKIFATKKNSTVERLRYNGTFYVLAPKNHFVLEKRIPNDPILFWQPSHSSSVFEYVSHWGNDLSVFNFLKATLVSSGWVIPSTFILLSSIYMILNICIHFIFGTSALSVFYYGVPAVIILIISIIRWWFLTLEDELIEDKWNFNSL